MKSLGLSFLSSLTLLLGVSTGIFCSKIEREFESVKTDSFLQANSIGKNNAWNLMYSSGSFSYLSKLINQLSFSSSEEKNSEKNLLVQSGNVYPEKLKQLITSFLKDLSWVNLISPIDEKREGNEQQNNELKGKFPLFKSKFLSLNQWIELSILNLILTTISGISLIAAVFYFVLNCSNSRKEKMREIWFCLIFQLPGWIIKYLLKNKEKKQINVGGGLLENELMKESDITISNLNYFVENNHILKNINLKLQKGEFYSIIGANGAGKTTLLKHIGRILLPQKGEILFSGISIKDIEGREYWKKVVYIPQELNIQLDTPVYDFLLYSRYLFTERNKKIGVEDHLKVLRTIKKCNLENLRWENMGNLSGGQKQKVILASILMKDAELILLDEPTTFLDIDNRKFLISFFKELHKQGKTIIANLHKFAEISQLSTKIIALKEGKIKKIGIKEEVLKTEFLNSLYDWELPQEQWDSLMNPSSNY